MAVRFVDDGATSPQFAFMIGSKWSAAFPYNLILIAFVVRTGITVSYLAFILWRKRVNDSSNPL